MEDILIYDETGLIVIGVKDKSVDSVTIPIGVKTICKKAFECCLNLHSVCIPNTVSIIEYGAFWGCNALELINIPNSVVKIEKCAFSGCASLYKIELSESLTEIESETFADCRSLSEVKISDSITSIGVAAFFNCINLEYIYIPKNVSVIEDGVFEWCKKLKNINVDGRNKYYSSKDGVLYNKNKTDLIFVPSGKNYEFFEIPETVSIIKERAFQEFSVFKRIYIPKSVVQIEYEAFNLGFSVDFYVNSSPNSIKCDLNAFMDYQFQESTLYIPIGAKQLFMESISFGKFKNIEIDYDRSILFSDNREAIIEVKDKSLHNIDIPACVKYIHAYALYKCVELKFVDIPNSVISIGSNAFAGCISLEYIDLPNSVKEIKPSTFQDCIFLESIDLPHSINLIGERAFSGCISLTEIVIHESAKIIEQFAFEGCESLNNIYMKSKSPNSIEIKEDSFDASLYWRCTLHIPAGTRWIYRHHPVFGKFKNIEINH